MHAAPPRLLTIERAKSTSRRTPSAHRVSPAQQQDAHPNQRRDHRPAQHAELDLHGVACAHAFKRQGADKEAHGEPHAAQRAHAEKLRPTALRGQLRTGEADQQPNG